MILSNSFISEAKESFFLIEYNFIFKIGRQNTLNIPIDASFTVQSEYILSGSSDGKVYVFNNKTSNYRKDANEPRHAILHSMQPEAITMVEMNPKYAMMATASSYVAFWAPTSD